jgi:hypothetical protein
MKMQFVIIVCTAFVSLFGPLAMAGELIREFNYTRQGIQMGEFIVRSYDLTQAQQAQMSVYFRKTGDQSKQLVNGDVLVVGSAAEFLFDNMINKQAVIGGERRFADNVECTRIEKIPNTHCVISFSMRRGF